MLSNKKKREIKKFDDELDEVFEFLTDIGSKGVARVDADVFMVYLCANEVIKHSKRLHTWTIVIAILTFILIVITTLDVWRLFAK